MEYEDKVYKKSNLEHNDSISTYDGWGAQQNPNAFEVFYNFLSEVKPSRILEIGIDVRVENVFNSHYTEVKQEVIDFIRQDGTTLILCDGGSKIHEFKILSDYMKNNDFIMAHDYSQNEETFKENVYMKIWNWHEISDKDIQESCEKNNLVSYNQEIFNKVAWVCKVKK
jgi:hypothetical protein